MSYTEALEALETVKAKIATQGQFVDDRILSKKAQIEKLIATYEERV